MTERGVLVAFEGPSGTGKSTVARLVADALRPVRVLLTREPSDGPLGLEARAGTGRYSGRALACLVAADRYAHLEEEVVPALAAGAVVICDRYVMSSFVLQRLDGVEREFISCLNAPAPRPDLYVMLAAAPSDAADRVRARGTSSRFQPRSEEHAAAEAVLYEEEESLAARSGQRLLRLDTTGRAPEAVAAQACVAISALVRPPTPPAPATR
jgi:dTMP kinase